MQLWTAPEERIKHQFYDRNIGVEAPEAQDYEPSSSSDEDEDDPATQVSEDGLDWRQSFLHKLHRHDAKLHETWIMMLRLSEAKAENKMLEYLLNKGQAEVKRLEYTSGDDNQELQSLSSSISHETTGKANGSSNMDSTARAEIDFTHAIRRLKLSSAHSADKPKTALDQVITHVPEDHKQAKTDEFKPPMLMTAIDEAQMQGESVQQGLLPSSVPTFEDANLRAERASARARLLEERLQQLEGEMTRRGLQTPPNTPPRLLSLSPQVSESAPGMRSSKVTQEDDKESAGKMASLRKRIFGRQKPMSAVSTLAGSM